jgi:hypothetical protein
LAGFIGLRYCAGHASDRNQKICCFAVSIRGFYQLCANGTVNSTVWRAMLTLL